MTASLRMTRLTPETAKEPTTTTSDPGGEAVAVPGRAFGIPSPRRSAAAEPTSRARHSTAASGASKIRRMVDSRVIRRQFDPGAASELAEVLAAVVAMIDKGAVDFGPWRAKLVAWAADKQLLGGISPAAAAFVRDIAHAAEQKNPDATELKRQADDYRREPDWNTVAGASFSPMPAVDRSNQPFQADEAKQSFDAEKADSGDDLEALIRMNIAHISIARRRHADELEGHDGSATVLVFLGPEWYFQNGNQPLTFAQRAMIIDRFAKVSRLYPDMVLVPGTIRSAEHRERKSKRNDWKNIRNTAFAVWNGRVLKELDKQLDAGDVVVDGKSHPKGFGQGGDTQASPLFEVGNLKFAIDVCADHTANANGGIREPKGRSKAAADQNGSVDVHLVTSAGQSLDKRHLANHPANSLAMSSDSDGYGATAQHGHDAKLKGERLVGSVDKNPNKQRNTVLTYYAPGPAKG